MHGNISVIEINGHSIRCAHVEGEWLYCLNDICRDLMGGIEAGDAHTIVHLDSKRVAVSGRQKLDFISGRGVLRLAFWGIK